jgi:hypothetical protein
VTLQLALSFLLLSLVDAAALRADLSQAMAQPNLEKRSRLALDNAQRALKGSREAYNNSDSAKVTALLAEVRQSVKLAEDSLKETGKNPRRSPKYFKSAEIQLRDLLKRVAAFRDDMNIADRSLLDPVRAKIEQVHDDILAGIMEGKKK